jgi:hypothetical protein
VKYFDSEVVTAIQAARSGVRVPVDSGARVVLPILQLYFLYFSCTTYTSVPLPSYSSHRYFIFFGFVYPRLLPLLLRKLFIFIFLAYIFSLLFFKRVPVVTKSPYYIRHIHPSVRPSTSTSAAPTEVISAAIYMGDVYKNVSRKLKFIQNRVKVSSTLHEDFYW